MSTKVEWIIPPLTPSKPTPSERIATALERIAAALEDKPLWK
jgi:hypothetical protein